jgi:hypothetical protein
MEIFILKKKRPTFLDLPWQFCSQLFWSEVWTGQIQEGLDTPPGKVGPNFSKWIIFPFSGNPKSMFPCFICSKEHGKMVYFFVEQSRQLLRWRRCPRWSDDNEKSWKIIRSNFFWTITPLGPLPWQFCSQLFWSKVWSDQIQKGVDTWPEKLDPIFQNELFFPFSIKPKSMFSWSIRPEEPGKMVYFFLLSILSSTYDVWW